MKLNWQELTRLTQGEEIAVERVRVERTGIAIEGCFELPPLTKLMLEDQVFVMAFVRSHGSIKEMERLFGVSYPTIKSRLNRIGERFGENFETVETTAAAQSTGAKLSHSEILDRVAKGELSAAEAVEILKS